jgi:replicative DNA helicase
MSDNIPYSMEVERAVLGNFLTGDNQDVLSDVTADHFFYSKNKNIFEVISMMRLAGEPVNLITVTSKLKDLDLLSRVGGIEYVSAQVINISPVPPDQYFPVLEEKLRLRKLQEIGTRLASQVSNSSNATSQQILDQFGTELLNFRKSDREGNMLPSVCDSVKEIITRKINGEKILGIKTGIHLWDSMLGGLHPRYYVLGARAGRGKTSMLEQMVDEMISEKKASLVFQADMSLELFILRIACRRAGVMFFKYDMNSCNSFELKSIYNHVDEIQKSKLIYLYSPKGLTISKLCDTVKIEKKIHDIKAVFIDHILKIQVGDDLRIGMTIASSKIRESVEHTGLPHVVLVQLNRGAEHHARPTPANIKEFDASYADCDTMIMLWSEKDTKDVDPKQVFPMKFLVNKNRFGTEFEDDIGFDRQAMKFKTMI